MQVSVERQLWFPPGVHVIASNAREALMSDSGSIDTDHRGMNPHVCGDRAMLLVAHACYITLM